MPNAIEDRFGGSTTSTTMAGAASNVDFFGNCSSREDLNTTILVLECVADILQTTRQEQMELVARSAEVSRNLYVLYAAALVFFMQAGFAMLCAGAVRKKNLQNTMLKNLLDACGSSVAFYAVGYAFAFGDGSNPNGFIGTTNFFLMDVEDYTFWIYQYAFSAASATIVAGTLAERCKMGAYAYYTTIVSGFVYPVVVHVIWSNYGVLSPFKENPFLGAGVIDFAGSGVVHMTGGCIALIATWVLGPRRGRFHDEKTGEVLAKPKDIKGHNMGLQLLGTMILWFGWYGFNSGSALLLDTPHYQEVAGLCLVTTTLAAGVAGITVLLFNLIIMERIEGKAKYDLTLTMNGVLAGLAGITGGCGIVEPWAAVIIGFVAGILYLCSSKLLIVLRLDDAVDAIPVHLVGGMWGMLSVGLFASPLRLEKAYGHQNHVGFFHSIFSPFQTIDGTLLASQIVGICFIIGWCFVTMLPFFAILDYFGLFRSDVMDELRGLDNSFHGGLRGNGEDALAPEAMENLERRILKTVQRNRTDASRAPSGARGTYSKASGSVGIDDDDSLEYMSSELLTGHHDVEVPMK
eukprot:CAMPEP_0117032456 /NCGR_PEP_ID=MMETSP0472-20121206/23262_1 /TAXON_ID=693140 ORGANISM="Tiarina fusus, Strain LIS" /NCGR_SAMPLE_ID=MMETSP0472 /ASSEMBLY_ACC=CAM_ASM_000603 /LENGTH=575 /DNA_ID=CAMNT_0004741095 /DNA_START=30 /DNA_END=1757 /DNA_ORIENTATION=-